MRRETEAVFPAPTVIEDDVRRLYGVSAIGRVDAVLLDQVLAERAISRNAGLFNQPVPLGSGYYVGVLGVEFFVTEGRLLVNEIAPRPHNSGHYTIEACATSQYVQQVRALCGLPLGDARLLSPAVMVNVLGDIWEIGRAHV